MSEAVWIGLWILGAMACVPAIARWIHNDTESMCSQTGSIAMAFVISYAWPFFVAWWLLLRLCRALAPLIFRGDPDNAE